MKLSTQILAAAFASCAVAAPALAAPTNQAPPPGAVFSLTGLPQTTAYTQYQFAFTAASTATNLTFAMRDDPGYLYLDDVSLTLLGSTSNLLTNGGFELGPVGSSTPTGWTYLNQYAATYSGTVYSLNAHSGSNDYLDGSVQAYDAITQAVSTVVGSTYNVSFYAAVDGGSGLYQPLSTNGNTTNTGGNAVDLFVYAQNGVPVLGAVPEPATWAMMIFGMGAVGFAMRRRQKVTTRVSYAA